jgi:hypothetical protein
MNKMLIPMLSALVLLPALPTLENRMKVVDAYLTAFKKTPLVMLLNGKERTTYATQHGTG